jgi:hypothetical protein
MKVVAREWLLQDLTERLRERRYGEMVAPTKTQAKFSGALQLRPTTLSATITIRTNMCMQLFTA